MSEPTSGEGAGVPTVVHDEAASRYEVFVDGRRGSIAQYELEGDVMTFTHTVTSPAMRGRGLAALVVGRALDDAQAAGRRVVAHCWFVAQFIEEHPEYGGLLDRPTRNGPG